MYLRRLAHVLLYSCTGPCHPVMTMLQTGGNHLNTMAPSLPFGPPRCHISSSLSLYHQPSSSPRILLLCFSYSCRDRVFASHPILHPRPRAHPSLIASPTQPGRIHCRHPSRLSTPSRLFTYTRAHPHPSHPLHLELAHSRRAYPWQPRSGFTPPPSCPSPPH